MPSFLGIVILLGLSFSVFCTTTRVATVIREKAFIYYLDGELLVYKKNIMERLMCSRR